MNKSSALLNACIAGVLGGTERHAAVASPNAPSLAASPTIKVKRPPAPAKAPKFNPNMNALKTTQMRKAMGRRS